MKRVEDPVAFSWGRSPLVCIALMFAGVASAQVPPPPAPAEQAGVVEQLIAAFRQKSLKRYSDVLADDLQVYEDGRLAYRNKADWLRSFGPKLTASGVAFTLSPGYYSSGRVLFIEYFNSMASWGANPPPPCCWRYDAVAYDIAGSHVTAIYRVRGGSETVRSQDK